MLRIEQNNVVFFAIQKYVILILFGMSRIWICHCGFVCFATCNDSGKPLRSFLPTNTYPKIFDTNRRHIENDIIRWILFCYFVKKVKLAITWQSNISTMSLLGNFMRHIKTWKIISIIYINIVKFSLKKFISSPSNIFIIVRLKKKSTSFCLYNISCHLNTVMEQ